MTCTTIEKDNPDPADVLPKNYHILDPACGSGGMFIQSARFVKAHKKNPSSENPRLLQRAKLFLPNLLLSGD